MPPLTREHLTDAVHRLARSREDEQAWEALFAASWPTAVGTTHRILRGQRDLAEDAAQEAFRRIVRYCDFGEIPDGDAFLAYLRAVCRNTARDLLRQLAGVTALARLEEVDTQARGAEPDQTYSPERQLRSEDLRRELLAVLDTEEQRLFHLLLSDQPLGEIAAELGLSYSNAGVRVHRLRAKLRKYMQDKKL